MRARAAAVESATACLRRGLADSAHRSGSGLGEESARNDGPRFQANVSEEDLRVKEDERVERGFAVVKAKLNRLLLKVGRMFERGARGIVPAFCGR